MASPAGGKLHTSGLADFLEWFSRESTLEEFVSWRGNPATVRFLGAIRALASNVPPAYLNRDSVELQYGVTSGLGLAASLIDDPTSVYPELFKKSVSTPGADADPERDSVYTVEPDA